MHVSTSDEDDAGIFREPFKGLPCQLWYVNAPPSHPSTTWNADDPSRSPLAHDFGHPITSDWLSGPCKAMIQGPVKVMSNLAKLESSQTSCGKKRKEQEKEEGGSSRPKKPLTRWKSQPGNSIEQPMRCQMLAMVVLQRAFRTVKNAICKRSRRRSHSCRLARVDPPSRPAASKRH